MSILHFRCDILGLSKTWNSSHKALTPISIEDYHPLERTKGATQNSGVGMHTKKTLNHTRKYDLSLLYLGMSCVFQYLFGKLHNSKGKTPLLLELSIDIRYFTERRL